MSLEVDQHRQFLQDSVRLDAFRRAVADVVRPGHVVVDLASGTGILGFFALQAGASRVYAVESTGIIDIARAVAAANGYGDRWVAVQGYGAHVSLPERADVVVCDELGRFGIEVDILEHAHNARRLYLKPGGTMLPGRVDLMLAPVEVPALFAQIDFWRSRPAGFDFSPARRWAANTGYPIAFSSDMLLGPPIVGASLDLREKGPSPFRCRGSVVVARAGILHGIGGWFSAQLSPSVAMTNAPTASERIGRRNVFFPLDPPIEVHPGDVVEADLHVIPPKAIGWNASVSRDARTIARFRHSTLNGMLLTADELRRTRPGFVPHLTDRGIARQTVLELCDGARPLAEIEREVFARHGALFPSQSDAALFVAEVVTRYTR
jgi:protein arginine N-methyltransferase 1